MWDGDFGEDEKGEFCDAVGSGGWHCGDLIGGFGLLVWFVCLGCLFALLVWSNWFFIGLVWSVGGLRSAK